MANNKLENVEVQLIEEVKGGDYDVEGKLSSREKYWQAQLLINLRMWKSNLLKKLKEAIMT